jgi:hypothetical protein
MNMKHWIVAASLALVPSALADEAAKAAAKAAKEKAKQAAIEAAKKKAAEKAEVKAEVVEKKVEAKKEAIAVAAADAGKANDEMHAKNLGVIERIEQIANAIKTAEAQKSADLLAKVAVLKTKEEARHKMAVEMVPAPKKK